MKIIIKILLYLIDRLVSYIFYCYYCIFYNILNLIHFIFKKQNCRVIYLAFNFQFDYDQNFSV
jgi:hypothetical protein